MIVPALPGEATLVASWRALARRSHRATVTESPRSVAAVFPAWAPLNNAIARMSADDAEPARLSAVYRAAGVDSWSYWIPSASSDLTAPDEVTTPGLVRDVSTLVMRADLDRELRVHEDAIPTSVASAAEAGDEPVALGAIGEPGVGEQPRRVGDGAGRVGDRRAVELRARGRLRHLRGGDRSRVSPPRGGPVTRGTRARGCARPGCAHRIAPVHTDGGVALSGPRVPGRRPLRGVGRRRGVELLVEPDPVEQRDAVDLESRPDSPTRGVNASRRSTASGSRGAGRSAGSRRRRCRVATTTRPRPSWRATSSARSISARPMPVPCRAVVTAMFLISTTPDCVVGTSWR